MSLGFYVNLQQCIGCRTCQVACKDRHDIHEAGVRTRRVDSFEAGEFPTASIFHTVVSCNHCESPACVANCPTGASFKSEDGTVLHSDELCIRCQACVNSCPYGAPQYYATEDRVVKCDSCKDLRDAGMPPVCVAACPMRAIEFGDIDELKAKHGSDLVSEMPCLPSAAETSPNLLIRPLAASLTDDFVAITL